MSREEREGKLQAEHQEAPELTNACPEERTMLGQIIGGLSKILD